MAIPTHESSCMTKAFLTNCPACKKSVWFFSCSCGSKVYFDELGAPWLYHYCEARKITDALEFVRSSERMTKDEIFSLITLYEKEHSVEISDDILEIIEDTIGKRKYPFTTEQVPVNNTISDISGRVMEFNKEVNLNRKFGYSADNIFGQTLMGELGDGIYGEITLREKPDKRNVSKEYKILVKQSYYKKNHLKIGDFILGNVKVVYHGKGISLVLTAHKVY